MSADRNAERRANRVVRSWLREDRHEDADRVLGAVLDQLDTTPQRRSTPWSAWRDLFMNNNVVRVGLVAAAAVIIAVIAINLLPGASPAPGGQPTPIPSAAASAMPSASQVAAVPANGPLTADTRYQMTTGPAAFTFAVPTTGWNVSMGLWINGHGASRDQAELLFLGNTDTPGIYADPCAHTGQEVFDESAAGEAEAYASFAGAEVVTAPEATTVDGRQGSFVEVFIPADVGCSPNEYWLWHSPDCPEVTIDCTLYPTWLDSTIRTWIVDIEGGRLTIQTTQRYTDASPDLEQELQQIVDSIQFE